MLFKLVLLLLAASTVPLSIWLMLRHNRKHNITPETRPDLF